MGHNYMWPYEYMEVTSLIRSMYRVGIIILLLTAKLIYFLQILVTMTVILIGSTYIVS